MNLEKRSGCGCFLSCFFVALGTLLVVGLAGWGWLLFTENRKSALVNAELAALRERGAPVDDASLDAMYVARTSDEHTSRWIALLEAVDSPGIEALLKQVEPNASGEPKAEAQQVELDRNLLSETVDLRSELHALLQMNKAVRFPMVFCSIETDLSHVTRLRTASKLLQAECRVAMRDNDAEVMFRAVVDLYQLSQVLVNDPFIVSSLVIVAIEGSANVHLKQALQKNLFDKKELEKLQAVLPTLVRQYDQWSFIMQGERAGMIPIFTTPGLIGSVGVDQASRWGVLGTKGDLWNYLRYVDRFETIDLSDYEVSLKSCYDVEFDFASERKNATWLDSRNWVLSSITFPAGSAVMITCIEQATSRDLAQLAIAIRLYQAIHGQLPDSLDQLCELGVDASKFQVFRDKPYAYMREGNAATLWGPVRQPSKNGLDVFLPTPDQPPKPSEATSEEDSLKFLDAVWEFS